MSGSRLFKKLSPEEKEEKEVKRAEKEAKKVEKAELREKQSKYLIQGMKEYGFPELALVKEKKDIPNKDKKPPSPSGKRD